MTAEDGCVDGEPIDHHGKRAFTAIRWNLDASCSGGSTMLWLCGALAVPPPPTFIPLDDFDGDGVSEPEDCDDNDPFVHSYMPDLCDGIDNDCDGDIDEHDVFTGYLFPDHDGDGFGTYIGFEPFVELDPCNLPTGWATNGTDCEPLNPHMPPAVVDDQCDGVDDDCDQIPDNDSPHFEEGYVDRDGDGWGSAPQSGCDTPDLPIGQLFPDCNDQDPLINPDATEIWGDEIDQNCNGEADDAFPDMDEDGFGIDEDCDDLSPDVNPGRQEACGNGIDDDCDGMAEEGCELEIAMGPSKTCSCGSTVASRFPRRQ